MVLLGAASVAAALAAQARPARPGVAAATAAKPLLPPALRHTPNIRSCWCTANSLWQGPFAKLALASALMLPQTVMLQKFANYGTNAH